MNAEDKIEELNDNDYRIRYNIGIEFYYHKNTLDDKQYFSIYYNDLDGKMYEECLPEYISSLQDIQMRITKHKQDKNYKPQ